MDDLPCTSDLHVSECEAGSHEAFPNLASEKSQDGKCEMQSRLFACCTCAKLDKASMEVVTDAR